MGHYSRESTQNYAKPITLLLEVEQRVNASIMQGFAVTDRGLIEVKITR
jgi:hypothetical protein